MTEHKDEWSDLDALAEEVIAATGDTGACSNCGMPFPRHDDTCFVLNLYEDAAETVRTLIAEVRRLQAENEEMRNWIGAQQ